MVKKDRLLVSIVLATYWPDSIYFKKQLMSLDDQTYPELELVVVDDSGSRDGFDEVCAYLQKYVRNIPFRLYRNERNLGSTKTFEEAVRQARGGYIAFCDQDDIWHKDKIDIIVEELERSGAQICYSDMDIIDNNGMLTRKGLQKRKLLLKSIYGEDLLRFFIHRNVISGCSMLVRAGVARDAIPFPEQFYYHDHWIAIYASYHGSVAHVKQALIQYRIHGNNQVGLELLKNIHTLEDYAKRLELKIRRCNILQSRLSDVDGVIDSEKDFLKRRLDAFSSRSWFKLLRMAWSHKALRSYLLFESLICIMPSRYGEALIGYIRK